MTTSRGDETGLAAGPRAVVAIDGPSGSGKSTVARRVAARLGFRYLDTGALYRALTWLVLDRGVDPGDPAAVASLVRAARLESGTDPDAPTVGVAGRDLTAEIREPQVTAAVSAVAAIPAVRAHLLAVQRELVGAGRIVVEGRDIGTTVVPTAEVKVFLTASAAARAARRHAEQPTAAASVDGTHAALTRRDELDSGRSTSPLRRADDAVEVDSTSLGIDDVVARVLAVCAEAGLTGTAAPAAPAPDHGSPSAGTEPTASPGTSAAGPANSTVTRAARPPASSDTGTGEPADAPPGGTHLHLVDRPVSPRRGRLPDASFRPGFYRGLRWIGPRLLGLIFDLRVSGTEHVPARGPVLLAGNHSGFLDGPVVAATVPREARFLAKSELFRGPLAHLLVWVGQIPVDRGRPDRAALRTALAVLRDGGALGVFPEGTRGRGGTLETVQHGVGYLAVRVPGVPIVPVACVGTLEALPKGRRLPRWGTRVDVVFGEPFRVTAPANPRARSAVAAAAEEIRVRLAAHVAAVEAGRAAADAVRRAE